MQIRRILLSSLVIISIFFSAITTTSAMTFGRKLCNSPGLHCQRVKSRQTWQSLFPNAHDRGIVMRLNRMNTQIYAGMVIAVPDNLETADIMDFSPFPLNVPSPGEKVIIIDPTEHAWGAYAADGNLVRWGPASSGADFCRDIDEECHTDSGSFRIYSLGSSDCYSKKFPLPDGGAPMPYCMYFEKGQALHGEPNGLPGYNASHGCVRMYVNDAEWLRYDFAEGPQAGNKYRGTRVIVKAYD